MSAKTGDGFDALVELLEQRGDFGQRLMDVDYDIYAEGEAELGWLNSSLDVSSPQAVRPRRLAARHHHPAAGDSLAEIDAETAHLKAIGMADGLYGVANLVSSFSPPELSLPSRGQVHRSPARRQRPRRHRPRNAHRRMSSSAVHAACRRPRRNSRHSNRPNPSAPAAPSRRIASWSRRLDSPDHAARHRIRRQRTGG